MHSKSNSAEIMINDKADEVTEELSQSLLSSYQIRLGTSMRDRDFIFDCVQFLYYKRHKINLKRGGSNRDSPDWIQIRKNKNKPYQ